MLRTLLFLIIGIPLYLTGYHEQLQPFLYDYDSRIGTLRSMSNVDDDFFISTSYLNFNYTRNEQNVFCRGPIYNPYVNSLTVFHYKLDSEYPIFVRKGRPQFCVLKHSLEILAIVGFVFLCIAAITFVLELLDYCRQRQTATQYVTVATVESVPEATVV